MRNSRIAMRLISLVLALGGLGNMLIVPANARRVGEPSTGLLPAPVPPTRSVGVDQARVKETLHNTPLAFIENRGQVDAQVLYYLQGRDTTVYFTKRAATFSLSGKSKMMRLYPPPLMRLTLAHERFGALTTSRRNEKRWNLKLDFVGASANVALEAQGSTPGTTSYFQRA